VIALTVNGRSRSVEPRAHETLLELLRREFGTMGVREACGIGMCGACTVEANGRTISSCLLLAGLADGLEIKTVEGLAGPNGELSPLQQAFVDHTAFQCSYCTPGFLMATRALLEENPEPTEDEIRHALAGNLCRCGSYLKIIEAVQDAAGRARGTTEVTAS
jgi:aerobic-type carbon monoxide dehydrogenase small subunit (CoxS/CutS family)